MHRQLLIILTISVIYCNFLEAEKNCSVSIKLYAPEYSTQYLKFGHYYGKQTYLIDSLKVETNGYITFSDSLHPGIYLLITPTGHSYEIMIAESGNLIIHLPSEIDHPLQISGNDISEAFNNYLARIRTLEMNIDSLKDLSNQSEKYTEKIAIQRISKGFRDSIDIIVNTYVSAYEGTLLGNYLRSLLPVKLPVIKIPPHVSNPDSFRWVQSHAYFHKHYLDNVSFNDNGLIYTPVLEDKVITYLTRFIEQKPESITKAIDSVIYAIEDAEVYQFSVELLINKYNKSKHKALDEYIYLHIIKEYYLSGKTPWATNRQIRFLTDDYNRCKPASIFQKAPKIILPDQFSKQQILYTIQADYTIVIFWDYDCPYCRRALDDVKKTLQQYSDKNISVFTVFTGNDLDVWKAFLARKVPPSWINTHLQENYSVIKQYNINQTPSIFLLDSEMIILDKNFTAFTLGSFLKKIYNS